MSHVRNPATVALHPDLLPLIRDMDPRGGLAPFTVEEKRQAYRQAVSRSGAPESVAAVSDRAIAGSAGEIPIRIYQPKLGEGQLAILVYLHGGGFVSGDLDTHDPVCRLLANQVPAVVVAVHYRLASSIAFQRPRGTVTRSYAGWRSTALRCVVIRPAWRSLAIVPAETSRRYWP